MISTYPACFFKEEQGYTVIFPDLNWLATCGDTLEEAFAMAVDCLAGFIYEARICGDVVAEASGVDKINISDEIRRDICSLIDYYLDISDIGEDAVFRINNFILRSLDSMKKVKAETSKDFSEYDKRFREFLLSAGDCDDGEF